MVMVMVVVAVVALAAIVVAFVNILVWVAGLSNMDGELFAWAGVTWTGADIIAVPDIVIELKFVILESKLVDLSFGMTALDGAPIR